LLPYYLILCRSLTHAQRTAFTLERVGITAPIQRAPSAIAVEGCSHVVRVAERHLPRALSALSRAELSPSRVFLSDLSGDVREVEI